MTRRHPRLAGLGLLLLPLTACSITATGPQAAGPPAAGLRGPASSLSSAVHVYFYSEQGLERVSRLYRGADAPGAALRHLASGPDAAERARGLVSYADRGAAAPTVTARTAGTLEVYAPRGWESRSAQRQLVCTAAAAAAGTGLHDVRVKVHRAADGDTVTQVCTGAVLAHHG
ncbi:hypothetical protein AB0I81_02135 [Nonomuraea sp. NPDC050404]|uniref:hypothetical protein n=1 Tax=Nonomuraea sp. NPDC050404 TaxID=3155783 RepID=UPI0034013C83